jgi:pyruvate dehydrogenase kinase 2/3/4
MHALAAQDLSGDSFQVLLRDVAIRLASQQSRLVSLQEELREGWGRSRSNKTSTTGSDGQQRIIQAVNQPLLRWKEWNYDEGNRDKVRHSALKAIHNLQVLHSDTFRLSSDLLDQHHVFSNFTTAHQHLVRATMEQIRSRHASAVEVLADLTISARPYHAIPTPWMDAFLSSRLGIQLLCDHAVQLPKKPTGGVSVDCPLGGVVTDAVTEAKHVVDAHLPVVPDITLPDSYPSLTLIRPWVHHALVELLKNSMAACVKRARTTEKQRIVIDIDESDAAIAIHIHDQGPGVSNIARALSFAMSGDSKRWDRLEEQQSYAMVRSPLSSLGVGLPLARGMMRHFGGDLTLINRDLPTEKLDTGATATIILPKNDTILEKLAED